MSSTKITSRQLNINSALDVQTNKVTNVGLPTTSTDAANKQYVDGAVKYFKTPASDPTSSPSIANGQGQLAIGDGAHVMLNIEGATAVGLNASAYGDAIAIGRNANALGQTTDANGQSIAIGNDTTAYGESAIAIGSNSYAGITSLAIGHRADARGEFCLDINGSFAGACVANGTVRIWSDSTVLNGNNSSAILGGYHTLNGQSNITFGGNSVSGSGQSNIAVHSWNTTIAGTRAAVFAGDGIVANEYNAVWLGRNNTSIANSAQTSYAADGLALGIGNGADPGHRSNALEVYYDGTIKTANGTTLVNAGGEFNASLVDAPASNPFLATDTEIPIAAPTAVASNSLALGSGAHVGSGGINGIAIGDSAVSGSNAIAIQTGVSTGIEHAATGNYSIGIGIGVIASGTSSTAIQGGSATGIESLAIGYGAYSNSTGAIAIGHGVIATADGAVAIGHNNNYSLVTASGDHSVVYGTGIASGTLAIALNSYNSEASGFEATVLGGETNTAAGRHSTTIGGKGLTSTSNSQTVLGRYNNSILPAVDANTYSASDPLLIIGNGLDGNNKGNAFVFTGDNRLTIGSVQHTDVSGKLIPTVAFTTVSSTYSAAVTDCFIGVDCSSASLTITLPAISSITSGREYFIKDITGSSATHNITITTSGSDVIDGASSKVISTNWNCLTVIAGTSGKWYVRSAS